MRACRPTDADGKVVLQPLTVAGKEWQVTCVSMGNPHAIVFVDDVDALDLATVRSAPFMLSLHTETQASRILSHLFCVLAISPPAAAQVGPPFEVADVFPAKTNTEFVQVLSPTHLKMKVWERGAGPTLACGTGACALTVAAILAGVGPKQDTPVTVTLPGGDLVIEWQSSDNKIFMTGPAQAVYSGVYSY